MTSFHVYYPNSVGTADSLSGSPVFTYAGPTNPGYVPTISQTVGPVLYFLSFDGYGNYGDYISRNLLNSVSEPSVLGAPITFTMTLDSKGRAYQLFSHSAPGDVVIEFSYY
jgi:hypothetical protein